MIITTIYRRVSSEEQALSGLGLEAQEETCKQYAHREGWTVGAMFSDEGVSASLPLDKRPALADAIGALQSGGVLLIAKRDRIFRSDPYTSAIIERAVTNRKARIISAQGEGTADDEPTSILMRRIFDAFGEYERLLIKSRTRAALRAKARRGERTGQIPYGKQLGADGIKLEVDDDELDTLALIESLRASGLSLRAIANHLTSQARPTKRGATAWQSSTVHALIQRKANATPYVVVSPPE